MTLERMDVISVTSNEARVFDTRDSEEVLSRHAVSAEFRIEQEQEPAAEEGQPASEAGHEVGATPREDADGAASQGGDEGSAAANDEADPHDRDDHDDRG